MIFAPGSVIDKRYEILESLGEGGFGTVYKARELSLDRLVALKFLHDDVRDTKSIGRFEREGKVLSKLSHPHIVKFYRFGLVGENVPYIAMEFVQGRSLRSLLDDTPQLPLQQFLKIAIQICDGLAAAHKEGIIHRDLKPSNIILMEEDNVKVVDFGVAKIINEDSDQCAKITQTGALIGSVFYMAPEQCLGAKIDHRIDIYALGCILYEMLTGSTPFVADENMAVILKHLKNEPQSITTLPNAKPVPESNSYTSISMTQELSLDLNVKGRYYRHCLTLTLSNFFALDF